MKLALFLNHFVSEDSVGTQTHTHTHTHTQIEMHSSFFFSQWKPLSPDPLAMPRAIAEAHLKPLKTASN